MNIEQVTQIFWQTDIVVIGTNPENADYDNPYGHIYGYCGYVIAEAPDGSRWVFNRSMTCRWESEIVDRLSSFVKHVQFKLDGGRKLDPQYWAPTRPGYGSDAYANGGWSQEDAMLERMADRDGESFFGQRS